MQNFYLYKLYIYNPKLSDITLSKPNRVVTGAWRAEPIVVATPLDEVTLGVKGLTNLDS